MAPADQRFRIGVQVKVQSVLRREELCGQWRHLARVGATGLHQAAHFPSGAKRLGSVAAQQHANDLRFFGPGIQLVAQGPDHRQREGIEGVFGIQAGNADAGAVRAGEFFEVQVHFDLDD
ncbi:hypothetical protein D3C78_1012390 [compost metagenome]